MSDTHDEIRALRVMVDELRAEAPPELAWDALEQRLLTRIAMSVTSERPLTLRPAATGSVLPRVLAFVAAAAAIALGVGSMASQSEMPRAAVLEAHQVEAASVALAPGAAGSRGERDLTALRPGDVIRAGDAPVSFARAGLVAWTLAPGSVVRVRSMGARDLGGVGHTVALERGSIRAEVTPRDPAEGLVEAFAVEVGGTRVAVHGTAFSVTIDDARAVVDVEHGAVAVGPVGHLGATTAHLLVGPSRAVFSLDGGRTARLLPRAPEPIAALIAGERAAIEPAPGGAAEPVHAAAPAQGTSDTVNAAPAAPLPVVAKAGQASSIAAKAAPEAPAAPAMLTVGTVRANLEQCFRRSYEPGSTSVQVSVSSTLRLELNPDGSVRAKRFDPPLKPELLACAFGINGRFAEGTGNVEIPVSFQP